jgi:hypothetical protein
MLGFREPLTLTVFLEWAKAVVVLVLLDLIIRLLVEEGVANKCNF